MLGGLHVEMALWSTLGDLLDKSGWTAVLSEAEVALSGVADSFLKATHLTRTRHAHQVTTLALNKLEREAFSQCLDETSMSTWEEVRKRRSPRFLFWDSIIEYETLVSLVVRAQRQHNFNLYVAALGDLVP
ncbi:unnamed protein product, partial [Porites evermanni]